jgi:hypothetical protein
MSLRGYDLCETTLDLLIGVRIPASQFNKIKDLPLRQGEADGSKNCLMCPFCAHASTLYTKLPQCPDEANFSEAVKIAAPLRADLKSTWIGID